MDNFGLVQFDTHVSGALAPAPEQKRQAVRALTEDMIADYRPARAAAGISDGSADTPSLPRMLEDVEAMLAHPRVAISLTYYKGGVAGAELELEDASSPEVGAWALAEAQRFWQRGRGPAQRSYDYGRGGSEAVYTNEDGSLRLDRLQAFHPLDCRVLTTENKYAGIRVVGAAGRAQELWGPSWLPAKGFWMAHNLRYSRWYGFPQTYPAWRPWRRLAGRDGAEEITDGAVYKYGIQPPVGRYPQEESNPNPAWAPTGIKYTNRDKMREFLEAYKSGAVIAMSSRRDEKGEYVWSLEFPKGVLEVKGLTDYCDGLEKGISLGVGVPPELLEASEVGSGYSGRAIPLEVFFAGQQENAEALLFAWYWQIGLPLLVWNFGPGAFAKIRVKNLLETRLQRNKQTGQDAEGQAPEEAGGGQRSQGGWSRSSGPRGGKVWRNAEGRTVYGERPPGQRFATDSSEPVQFSTDPGGHLLECRGGQWFSTRRQGEVWQGPSGRWFTVRDDGRVVPHAGPQEARQERTERAVTAGHEHVKAALAKGKLTARESHELAGRLLEMTVPQMHELKRRLGLKASGPKFELAAKLAARALAGVRARKDQTKDQTGKPPREPQPGKVYNVSTGLLKVDPGRFQYKLNVDAAAGVTQELKQVKAFNPDFAGVISVWKDPDDGGSYVVNGHHRHELASRLGQPDLAVRYVEAGTAKEARAVGALINIAEGRGTAVDAAKFMRDAGVGPEELEKRGVSFKGKLAADAAALTRLSDRSFDRLTRGLLDEGKALAVARYLPDHDLQDQLFGLLDKREESGKDLSLKVIEEMAREMAETPKHTTSAASLFGNIESEESLFVQRNEVKAHVRNEMAREVNDFLAVSSKRRAERVGSAGNVLDVEKNREIAQKAEQAKNTFDQLVNRKGAVSDAINQAAADYASAKTKRERDAAKERAAETVKRAVFGELGLEP